MMKKPKGSSKDVTPVKDQKFKTPKRTIVKSGEKGGNIKFNGSGVLSMVRSPSENIESPADLIKTDTMDGNIVNVNVVGFEQSKDR
jgi:hypothetical protein